MIRREFLCYERLFCVTDSVYALDFFKRHAANLVLGYFSVEVIDA